MATNDTNDFPRGEAARLVSASLRPSRFLLVVRREDDEYGEDGISEIRNYGVDYSDSVPVVDSMDPMIQDIVSDHLRQLLPNGGVICVPPPERLLCTSCRIGIRTHVTADDQELCDSCAMAFRQATGIAAKPITANTTNDPNDEDG